MLVLLNLNIELLGTVCGILSVFLLARGYAWGFLIGLINTFIYIYLDFNKAIYGQILVNGYYTGMNIWGLMAWNKKDHNNQKTLHYSYLLPQEKTNAWGLFFLFLSLLLLMNGLLIHWGVSKAATPYLDSLITALIFTAMWLSVRKKIESWYLWILVNLIAIVLFYKNELYYTVIQYAIYGVIAVNGFYTWKRVYKNKEWK